VISATPTDQTDNWDYALGYIRLRDADRVIFVKLIRIWTWIPMRNMNNQFQNDSGHTCSLLGIKDIEMRGSIFVTCTRFSVILLPKSYQLAVNANENVSSPDQKQANPSQIRLDYEVTTRPPCRSKKSSQRSNR
jgi:hypothetical protein